MCEWFLHPAPGPCYIADSHPRSVALTSKDRNRLSSIARQRLVEIFQSPALISLLINARLKNQIF